jgi:hypothetical protein
MGGRDLDTRQLGNAVIDPIKLRELAVHCADRVGAKHPTEHDDTDPKRAGRLTARNPQARDELLLLLDAIGYRKEQQ